jgi:hypothetical protein
VTREALVDIGVELISLFAGLTVADRTYAENDDASENRKTTFREARISSNLSIRIAHS